MPTKRMFDMVVIVGLLMPPAIGLLRSAARRWQTESTGAMSKVGAAVGIGLGR